MAARLPRPRLLVATIAILALLGGSIGLVLITWSDYNATLADWKADLSLSARLVEAEIRRLHVTADANLLRIGDRMVDRPLASLRHSDSDLRWLKDVLAGIPNGFAICIRDSDADMIVTTGGHGILAASPEAHEDMAQALRTPNETITGAIVAPHTKPGHFITFSRALVGRSGRVQGVAVIMVDTNGFNAFHNQIQTPDQGSIFTVARRDGTLIARFPMPNDSQFRFDNTKHPFTEFSKGTEGSYRASSVVDGLERMISFRHLPDLGLIATAGMTMDMVFHDWTARTQRNATLFAGGTLLLLILTLVTSESLRHEARLLHSMESKAEELAKALAEKDVLFQEVHHRVKNNLQVISSLLTMQSLHVGDDTARATLKDALDRIQSMGLVHQTLYERNLASNVDLGVYFGRLAEALVGSYGQGQGSVSVQVEVEGSLDLDRAVPLGMLANEALSNALKHAFPDGRSGSVSISLTRDESLWHFTIRDDGVGLPSKPSKGIGLSLIKALTRQLNGRSTVTRDGGTAVIVTFPV